MVISKHAKFKEFPFKMSAPEEERYRIGCLRKLKKYTVKPVYKDHSRKHENVAFMSSCPLYTG